MLQLLLHLTGDYLLQSDQMSAHKRSSSAWAGFHAVIYALPFLLLQPSWSAWSMICGTHFLIDRFGLARYVVWAKNLVLGLWPLWLLNRGAVEEQSRRRLAWANCAATGYPADVEPWLASMLLIVVDNTLHLLINYSSLASL